MSYLHSQRLALVREEYQALEAAVEHAISQWSSVHYQTEFVIANITLSQMRLVRQSASNTYIVGIFSVFEDILRAEIKARGYHVPYNAEALINRAARLSKISDSVRLVAQKVREYRNEIVHQGSQSQNPILFSEAATALNKFVRGL